MRQYNQQELTKQRGWDQYLTVSPKAAKPVKVIVVVTSTTEGGLNATGGGQGDSGTTSFFEPRVVVLTGAPPVPTEETCGGTGTPGGIQGVSPSESGGGTVPPDAQYDLITDLLDADMFKVYEDMLKSDKPRVKGGQSVKFGYLSMMSVATLSDLNAEFFCESVFVFRQTGRV